MSRLARRYNGEEGTFVSTQQYFKNPDCTVCGKPDVRMTVPASLTLQGGLDSSTGFVRSEFYFLVIVSGVFDMLGDHKVWLLN